MHPLARFPVEARRAMRGVLFDVDDTLTTDGVLTAEAYAAMERLHDAGLIVIPITGRPAGWCDHIARMWPVDGIVGENGALYFRYDRERHTMRRRYLDRPESRELSRARLKSVADDILRTVPGAAIAADQNYRETDLAIDFCEDVARLGDASVAKIVSIMQAHGLTAKVSSIHVNGWFGNYDKLTMTRHLLSECHGIDLEAERARFTFIGDSPNDAPMFEYLPHTIGVENVRDFAAQMTHAPSYVTLHRSGKGFREAADCILQAKL